MWKICAMLVASVSLHSRRWPGSAGISKLAGGLTFVCASCRVSPPRTSAVVALHAVTGGTLAGHEPLLEAQSCAIETEHANPHLSSSVYYLFMSTTPAAPLRSLMRVMILNVSVVWQARCKCNESKLAWDSRIFGRHMSALLRVHWLELGAQFCVYTIPTWPDAAGPCAAVVGQGSESIAMLEATHADCLRRNAALVVVAEGGCELLLAPVKTDPSEHSKCPEIVTCRSATAISACNPTLKCVCLFWRHVRLWHCKQIFTGAAPLHCHKWQLGARRCYCLAGYQPHRSRVHSFQGLQMSCSTAVRS